MYLSNKDYLDILNYYKIESKNLNKKQIKKSAENILANKLCRCIKKNDDYPKNESKAIAICKKSILKNKDLKIYDFKCKGKAKLISKKGTNKNLAKVKKRKTRRR
tara:strand:+ start:733 stop:1047 length:315 start_codon:yes stop_codon:yes gene_type:complete